MPQGSVGRGPGGHRRLYNWFQHGKCARGCTQKCDSAACSDAEMNKVAAFMVWIACQLREDLIAHTETHQTKEKTLSASTSSPTQKGW